LSSELVGFGVVIHVWSELRIGHMIEAEVRVLVPFVVVFVSWKGGGGGGELLVEEGKDEEKKVV